MNKIVMVAATVLLAPGAALAEGLTKLPYTGLQASYASSDIEDFEEDATGVGFSGFYELGRNVFVTAGYETAKTEDFTVMGFRGSVELTGTTFGIGYHYALNPVADLVVKAGMVSAETDFKGDFNFIEDERDNGWSADLALRALVTPYIELTGGFGYLDIYDDDSTGFLLEAFFYPMPHLGIGAGYDVADDAKTLIFSGRVVF